MVRPQDRPYPGYTKDGLPKGGSILNLPADEADAVMRRSAERRGKEEAKVARRRARDGAKGAVADIKPEAWERAFEAVIMFYEVVGDDMAMADLLRLDLDRYVRRSEVAGQVEWAKKKDKAG
jgi:hypothetical protein